jgi:hypothetical protein
MFNSFRIRFETDFARSFSRFLASTRAEARRIINALVALASVDEDFDIESFINYFQLRGAFTPRQLGVLIWRLKKRRIDFSGCKFKVIIRRNREKVQLEEMPDWQLRNIWPYLADNQKQVCKALRTAS